MKGSGATSILVLVISLSAILSHHEGVGAVRSPGTRGGDTVVAKRNNWWTKRALLPTIDQVAPSLSSSSGPRPINRPQSNNVLDITALNFCERLGYFGRILGAAGPQGGLKTVLLRPNLACICADAPGEDIA
ncbi:uncharacterized protein LOC143023873 [Oratosquilla oratoria]|uniref:uncharacterized protein LOC143023873 n=1 Tax=Oratosquilla oratoria TaxID=337810 RepID=UPI003F7572A2